MKNIWKWILGILLVLVLASGLFYAGTLVANNGLVPTLAGTNGWQHPMMGARGFDRGFDRGFERGFGPMMGGSGYFSPAIFLPIMFFGGLLRLILPLGLFALVIWFVYQQGKKAGAGSASVAPAAESTPETPTE
jgi:uncharacterized membrane protein